MRLETCAAWLSRFGNFTQGELEPGEFDEQWTWREYWVRADDSWLSLTVEGFLTWVVFELD